MDIEVGLKSSMEMIPQCISAAVIGLKNGMMVANVGEMPNVAHLDQLLPAAARDIFAGTNVEAVETAFAERAATSGRAGGAGLIDADILIVGPIWHFMWRLRDRSMIVVFVCRKPQNLGMVFARLESALKKVNELF